MRKIDTQAAAAFSRHQNFKGGNTQAIVDSDSNVDSVYMLLHGNEIAHLVTDKKTSRARLYISNCGYATNVTHSRLNAVLSELGIHATIHAKQGESVLVNRQGEVLGYGSHVDYCFNLMG